MAGSSKVSVASRTRSIGADRSIFVGFLVLFPLLIYPQFLVEMVWEHRGIYFSNGELVYYVPRLVAMLLLALLTRRSWTMKGWFPKILVGNAVWISFVTVLHPDADGLWYTLGGNIGRLDGLLYQFLLVGVGMTAYGLVLGADNTAWRLRFRSTMAFTGLIPAVLVLLQGAGADPVGWFVWGKPLPFASATLGHPGFAACVLLISTLVALVIAADLRRNLSWWITVLALEAGALGVTGNRTALIALAGGSVTVLLLKTTRLRLVLVTLALVLAASGSLAPKWIGASTTNGEQHLVNTNTLDTRLQLWQIAGHALTKSAETLVTGFGSGGLLYAAIEQLPAAALVPFWRLERGWGASTVERFAYSSNGPQYRDVLATAVLKSPAGEVRTDEFYPSVDKAHDYFLDRSLGYGVVDALLWAILFLAPILRAFRRGATDSLGLVPVAAALIVYGITWFGAVQTEPLQLIVLAAMWAVPAKLDVGNVKSASPVINGT